jgi:3-methylcrotonyl-CoA carboxylase alpha subunit
VEFLERLVRHPAVVEGRIDTGYLDRHLDEFLAGAKHANDDALFTAATAVLLDEETRVADAAAASADPHSPWARADAWRIGRNGKRIVCFTQHGVRVEVDAHGSAGNYVLENGGATRTVTGASTQNGTLSAALDGRSLRYRCRVDESQVVLHDGERRTRFDRIGAFAFTLAAQASSDRLLAPMPGRIVVVKAKSGDQVQAGQELLVMEAMKMEIALKAPHAAKIETITATAGEFVEADTVLVRFAAEAAA